MYFLNFHFNYNSLKFLFYVKAFFPAFCMSMTHVHDCWRKKPEEMVGYTETGVRDAC